MGNKKKKKKKKKNTESDCSTKKIDYKKRI